MSDCSTPCTPEDVRLIIDTGLSDEQIQAFIDAACEVITEVTANCGYSEAKLTQLCTWLAAHFATVIEPQVTSERIGSRSVVYASSIGQGLDSSRYGQMVQVMDTCGALRETNKGRFLLEVYSEYD